MRGEVEIDFGELRNLEKLSLRQARDQKNMDTGSGVLLSLGTLFSAVAGSFLQTNFLYAVICAVIAVVCIMLRETVKQ